MHATHSMATVFTINFGSDDFLGCASDKAGARETVSHASKGVHHWKEGLLGVTEPCAITALIPPIRVVETMSDLPHTIRLVESQICKPFFFLFFAHMPP